ncbi:hypothetical protein M0805_000550 [Coniferiporia weirii]|nr:hypothetical protein M0805_000550 [Coniferiporia weirii]
MSSSSQSKSPYAAFEKVVLSWTSHPRLARATEPSDYDLVLKYTMSEMKFHCVTLLTILFFMAADDADYWSCLISTTLACLIFTRLTYAALGTVSGEALHKWIEEAPRRRVMFACFSKLPALSVLGTLCALALLQWDTPFTTVVLSIVAGVLVLSVIVRMRSPFARVGRWMAGMCGASRRPRVERKREDGENSEEVKNTGLEKATEEWKEGGKGEKEGNAEVFLELPLGPERV